MTNTQIGVEVSIMGGHRQARADRVSWVGAWRDVIGEALSEALSANGLAVSMNDRDRSEDAGVVLDDGSGTDAVLSVDISNYGYQLHIGEGWRPFVFARVTLTDPVSGDLLLDDEVVFGTESGGGTAVIALDDPRHRFDSVDGFIENNPDLAISALRFGLQQTAREIAGLVAESPAAE